MSVIRTDRWLVDLYRQPIEICERLKGYFEGTQAYEIYDYLSLHGMYRPLEQSSEQVKKLQENNVWAIVENENKQLEKTWDGPKVPVFIFPSDITNQRMKVEFQGKAGLAFPDKLFLFISADNSEKEIRSLFTHEYNHVCRLAKFPKKEADYLLLDTIVLEGLAENAVRERFGEEYTVSWTAYYSTDQLETIWNNLVHPNRKLSRTNPKYQAILYGLDSYPKMAGYSVGYYIVQKYLETNKANNLTSKALLPTPTDEFDRLQI